MRVFALAVTFVTAFITVMWFTSSAASAQESQYTSAVSAQTISSIDTRRQILQTLLTRVQELRELLRIRRESSEALSQDRSQVLTNPQPTPPPKTSLKYVICDLKRSLAQREESITRQNYKQVINNLKNKVGCNGIRVGIDSKTGTYLATKIAPNSKPEGYTQLYYDVLKYARQQGLLVYANLLPEPDTAEYTKDTKRGMINRVTAYAKHFCPDFLGPFNENGGFNDHSDVVQTIKSKLPTSCTDPWGNTVRDMPIIGPDAGVVRGVDNIVRKESTFVSQVDIISSHNNAGGDNTKGEKIGSGDRSMIVEDWKRLRSLGGNKPVWASEAHFRWNAVPGEGENAGEQVGVKAIVDSRVVSGLVLYMAPKMFKSGTYELSLKGSNLVDGLCAAGWQRSCQSQNSATQEPTTVETGSSGAVTPTSVSPSSGGTSQTSPAADADISGSTEVAVGKVETWTVTSADANATFSIDWGDGRPNSREQKAGGAAWHAYWPQGVYIMTATVNYSDGTQDIVTQQVSVN